MARPLEFKRHLEPLPPLYKARSTGPHSILTYAWGAARLGPLSDKHSHFLSNNNNRKSPRQGNPQQMIQMKALIVNARRLSRLLSNPHCCFLSPCVRYENWICLGHLGHPKQGWAPFRLLYRMCHWGIHKWIDGLDGKSALTGDLLPLLWCGSAELI